MKSQAIIIQYVLIVFSFIFISSILAFSFHYFNQISEKELNKYYIESVKNYVLLPLTFYYFNCLECEVKISLEAPKLKNVHYTFVDIYQEDNKIILKSKFFSNYTKLFGFTDKFLNKKIGATSIAPIEIYYNSSYSLMIKNSG